MASWVAILTSLIYLCLLFSIAHFGDTRGRFLMSSKARPYIYALTFGVYCTSWTFFGSVGVASTHGLDFLPIYLGPIIVIGLFFPFVMRIICLAKTQNIASVADFVAARYGKSEKVAAFVAIICVVAVVPYTALQLKAIANSLTVIVGSFQSGHTIGHAAPATNIAIGIALALAVFAMAFGTRHIDATEHQDGLILAVAAESLIKLIAFVSVGLFVVFGMFDGFGDVAARARAEPTIQAMLAQSPDWGVWLTSSLLSACAIILLPRLFYVVVVENRDEGDVKKAAWIFPLYLIAMNLLVVPLAVAGLLKFAPGTLDRDMTVLALPLEAGANIVALIGMIGGLSSATTMVVVSCVALSIMMSNDLIMPLLLRGKSVQTDGRLHDIGALILSMRRLSIIFIMACAFLYFKYSSSAALASIGLLSFAAIVQIAPAFFGGLVWRRATARGAMAGLCAGMAVWIYTIFLPSLETDTQALTALITNGPMNIGWLRPTALFGSDMPSLVHGTFWSLAFNICAYIGFSLMRHTSPLERLQATAFIGSIDTSMAQSLRLWRGSVTVHELENMVGRYLGDDRARRAFENFARETGEAISPSREADMELLRFAEHLLSSAIGASSSRLVLSLLLRRRNVSRDTALKLVDDASAALQYNRDLLQYALDFARQGITVFDRDLRLICWNREFKDLFDLPHDRLRIGMGLEELLRFNAERGLYGEGSVDSFVNLRMELLVNESEPFRLRLYPSGNVIEIRSARLPDGGLVTTYTDVTQTVQAEERLEAANEHLEQRVRLRTEELQLLNGALAQAKADADDANLSKTRFLAAASHDLLQPLNAARLYATTLVERLDLASQPPQTTSSTADDVTTLAHHLDSSLEAVEEILTALLEISRLDAGAMRAELSEFRMDELLTQMKIEFSPLARSRGLELIIVQSSLSVRSDRRLLRRLLQNLISNAIKYTSKGRVLVGCRRHGTMLRIDVIDTGLGIPADKIKDIFREFHRLTPAAKTARGLGLGLSIVERIARVLEHPIHVQSILNKGSTFGVSVPIVNRLAPAQKHPIPPAPEGHKPLSGLYVIAIDNEPRILEGMQIMLAGWGCIVECCAGVTEAMNYAHAHPQVPDVIVADFHLDDGDGIEAIEALRAYYSMEVPAILVTADRATLMRERAGEANIRVLNKPLKPANLRSLLSQWRIQRANMDINSN
jgi:Na+/proline symporter/signal transduction histidine kinase/CheY-like chemotaxis protein